MTPAAFDTVLEALVDRLGDPVEPVYDALFARAPDLRDLFILDENGSVRGNMLNETLNLLRDLGDADTYASNFLRAEHLTHEGYGVPRDVFPAFLDAIEEVVSAALAGHWPDSDREAFAALLVRARAIVTPAVPA